MRRMLCLVCAWMVVTGLLVACRARPADDLRPPSVSYPSQRHRGTTLTWYSRGYPETDQPILDQFTADTGIHINRLDPPTASSDIYLSYQAIFRTRRADIDVLSIDVMWTKAFAPYLVDLRPVLGEVTRAHFPAMIQNNTIGRQLVGMPFYANVGLLFYRTDLLEQYGFKGPPETWEALERMAGAIQQGERRRNSAFVGYVWQGAPDESLTSNALEWQASFGGGQILNPESGAVELNNPRAIAAFQRAARWVGTISPANVTSFYGADSARYFYQGNAAFLREWIVPHFQRVNTGASPVRGKFGVVRLPHATGDYRSANTRGEWQLGISAQSRHRAAATEFVRYMTSQEVQRWRALHGGFPPTLPGLYRDQALLKAQPQLATIGHVLENYAVARPSWRAGARYHELSQIYYEGVGEILRGEDAQHAVVQMEIDIKALLK